jgi:hypothetical protein
MNMKRRRPNKLPSRDGTDEHQRFQSAKAAFNGDPSLLLGMDLLRPLAAFPFASQAVTDHIHSIGHGWYLLIGSREMIDDGLPANTIRACMILWARDVAGVLLATDCDDVVSQISQELPSELPSVRALVSANGWSYGKLVAAGRGRVIECAVYGSNGRFRCKELRFPKVDVFFQSRMRKNTELPFAIAIR